jgi:hypothetical protein
MSRERGSLLGVLAYVVVPGERRRKAATHFRRAGIEAVKGAVALLMPEASSRPTASAERQRIEIS